MGVQLRNVEGLFEPPGYRGQLVEIEAIAVVADDPRL
jgi:hypothetical protein